MHPDQQGGTPEEIAARRKSVLELVFISVLGIAVLGAFIAALTYDFVSARAPLFIMVPLLLLIGMQINRSRKEAHLPDVIAELSVAFRGKNSDFNSVAGFIGLMVLLLLLIYVAGHYVGISVFMFVLLRWISKEHPVLSLLIAVGVTVLIYFLFEHGFNIELYRGYIFRLLSRSELF
jgi:MFS family permease